MYYNDDTITKRLKEAKVRDVWKISLCQCDRWIRKGPLFIILSHKHTVVYSNYQNVQKIIASRLHQKKWSPHTHTISSELPVKWFAPTTSQKNFGEYLRWKWIDHMIYLAWCKSGSFHKDTHLALYSLISPEMALSDFLSTNKYDMDGDMNWRQLTVLHFVLPILFNTTYIYYTHTNMTLRGARWRGWKRGKRDNNACAIFLPSRIARAKDVSYTKNIKNCTRSTLTANLKQYQAMVDKISKTLLTVSLTDSPIWIQEMLARILHIYCKHSWKTRRRRLCYFSFCLAVLIFFHCMCKPCFFAFCCRS